MLIRDLSERTVALISDPWFLFYHKPKGVVATSTLLLATHRQNHCINIHVISVVKREIELAINICININIQRVCAGIAPQLLRRE